MSTNSSTTMPIVYSNDLHANSIYGRIFPTKDPYCFASFRIEIRMSIAYPFNVPEVFFLDSIYHSAVQRDSGRCCFCNFKKQYKPTTSLVEVIEHVLNIVDSSYPLEHCNDDTITNLYCNNYEQFYKTALEYTFKYGLPRQ